MAQGRKTPERYSARRDGRGARELQRKVEDGYERACDWLKTSRRVPTATLSRQRRSDFRRIKMLGDRRALELQRLGATFRVLRWVAGAARSPAEMEERFRAARKALQHGPLTEARWRELVKSRPALEPDRGAASKK
jgi:hypothetical protein